MQIFSNKDRLPRAFAKLVDAKKASKLDGDLIDDAINNVKKNEEQSERPQRLIDRAIDMLKVIKTDSAHFVGVTSGSLRELKTVVDDLNFKHQKTQRHGKTITKGR